MLRNLLLKAWLKKGPLARALYPLALLYAWLLRQRAQRFARSPRTVYRPDLPVIIVGNVVLGGVGKTPVVVAIVRRLQQMGFQPGVISRGYGRQAEKTDAVLSVTAQSAPLVAGDEPVMLAAETGVPVYVAQDRPAAMRTLLQEHPEVDVLVSDDGLQHWALQRDIEIIVWDERGSGNGWVLPAGLLREPWPRPAWHPYAARSGALHLLSSANALPPQTTAAVAWPIQRKLHNYALRADGSKVKLSELQGQRLSAVAGIAKPDTFFAALRTKGLLLEQTAALPDHADLAPWWHKLEANARKATWLCTQKDAAKLWQLNPAALAVPLELELPAAFWAALTAQLKAKLQA